MPSYEFKCKVCGRVTTELLPVKLRDDADIAPICCKQKMARIFSPVRHKFLVPPGGTYYDTIGDYASTESEFREKAAKVKADQREYFYGEK